MILRLLSWIVPRAARQRWQEEWRAEMQHGGWRMLSGALPDALTLRAIAREQARDHRRMRGAPFLGLDQDLRYALRGLVASPAFTSGVVLSLSVGMAVTIAAFAFVNVLVLRPPDGIMRADEVVQVRLHRWRRTVASQESSEIVQRLSYQRSNYDAFVNFRDSIRSLSGLAAYARKELTVAFPGEPLPAEGMLVSSNYFELLGVRPVAGRLLGATDEGPPGAHAVAVLSHDAWVRHFGGLDTIVGTTIRVNGTPLEVIGVAPPGFRALRTDLEDEGPAVWIPFSMSHLVLRDAAGNPAPIENLPLTSLSFVGRLAPGVPQASAQVELSVAAAGLDPPEPSLSPATAQVVGLRPRGVTDDLAAFMAIPLIVLALACVNAANLLSARASRRIRDAAVRLSVGATTWRIVRLMLVESLLLALGGAAVGLLFSWWIVAALESFLFVQLAIDWRVATFALGTSVLTALAFGMAPALASARRAGDLVRGMAGPRRTRTRVLLVGAQAALSLWLIATGWQFAQAVRTLLEDDGLQAADRLAIAPIDVGTLPWPRADVDAYYDRVLDRVRQLPGITHSALSCGCEPFGVWATAGGGSLKVWLPDSGPEKAHATLAMLSAGDLAGAMNLPVLDGRGFTPEDHRGPPRAVLVNKAFADRHFRSTPTGRTLRIAARSDDYSASRPVVIVGVIDVPRARRTDSLPMVYYPSPLEPIPARTLYVRFDRTATGVLPMLQDAIRELHPDVPRPRIVTAEERRWERQTANQYLAAGVSVLGLVALLLSAAGLYGVVSFLVTQRSQEIGIRLALGADTTAVVRMMVRQALTPALCGAGAGAFGAVSTGLIVRSRLYATSGIDPVVLIAATTLLMGVLLVASALPARRASRVDPLQVLRAQ